MRSEKHLHEWPQGRLGGCTGCYSADIMDAWASMIATWPKLFPSARDCEATELCRGVTRLGCPLGTLLPDEPDPMRSLRVAAEMGTWLPFVRPSA